MKRFLYSLRKRPFAIVSIVALVVLYGSMLFAEFLAPYTQVTAFRDHSYHPPNLSIYSSELGLRPQVQHRALVDQLRWRYVRIRGEHIPVRLFVRGPQYKLWGLIPMRIHLFGTVEAYRASDNALSYPVFLMGADHLGRDLFSRILYGSRISLTVGLIGILITLVYRSCWADWQAITAGWLIG